MNFLIDRTRLPSTSALTAFEAAARLLSFTCAARELNLTQGAISRQIKSLEDQLQVILFDRTAQGLRLTDIGRVMADQVRGLLDQFLLAMDEVSRSGPNRLAIGVLPSLAVRWLIPRVSSFASEYPNINLRILTTAREFDIDDTRFDATLTIAGEFPPGIVSHRIGDEEFVAIATPEWVADHGIKNASDLRNKKLLGHTVRPEMWNMWFAVNGIHNHNHTQYHYLEHYDMIICAAQNGMGVGLVPLALIKDEVLEGRFEIIESEQFSIGTSYFLSYPSSKSSYPPVVLFRNWLLGSL